MTGRRCILLLCLWAMAAMAQIQRAPPVALPAAPPVTPGTGSIEGVVTDSVSQEPVKKAQVSLGGPMGQPLNAVTDASGRFAFRELPAGVYWLNAWKSGYRPPQTVLGADANPAIALGDAEQKQGAAIALTPGSSISGRITNEDGNGVRGCSVNVAQPRFERGRRSLQGMQGASTDEKGEYRIADLPRGRYYLFVHCAALLPAAHPLLPPDDPRMPHDSYLPQFYGGGMDLATAAKIQLAAGAALGGIDMQVTRFAALTVRGSVTASDPEALSEGANLSLVPTHAPANSMVQWGGYADGRKRTFEIQPVCPGSYTLYAFAMHDGRMFAAERSVVIGKTAPDPIEIALAAGLDLKGSVQMDSEDRQPPPGVGQVSLLPVDKPMFGPQPVGQLGKDGAFTLTGVAPGRWRLNLSVPNYVKSVSLGGQPVSPFGFDIGPGTLGPLAIVLGGNMASITVHIAGERPAGQVAALIYPEDLERMGAGLERVGVARDADYVQLGGLPPGRYRVFATDTQNPWPILERPDILHGLENHTALIEVAEGGKASTTVEMIPREELLRAIEAQE